MEVWCRLGVGSSQTAELPGHGTYLQLLQLSKEKWDGLWERLLSCHMPAADLPRLSPSSCSC